MKIGARILDNPRLFLTALIITASQSSAPSIRWPPARDRCRRRSAADEHSLQIRRAGQYARSSNCGDIGASLAAAGRSLATMAANEVGTRPRLGSETGRCEFQLISVRDLLQFQIARPRAEDADR